ncbi:MAG: cyclodeaminase/cyclohydrolase family protein [Spirochaetaceae bacterium]|jgi:formiminotetrahydrofolate cyclodeaminase|nr:cyclodeaminase/cyclohydrolase family protein [Spirochaetaceae bacterium]
MKLAEQSVEEFSLSVASDSPVPGGGTGAAVSAALGASFIVMVARITAGKPEFAARKLDLVRIASDADEARRLFLRLADEDAAAYGRFAAVAKTPSAGEALRGCLKPPLETLEGVSRALLLARELSAAYYQPTASDVGIAALSLEAAARGACLTVHANLKRIKDSVFVTETARNIRSALASAEAVAAEIYLAVKRDVEI